MERWREGDAIPDDTVWIDMNHPSRAAELAVEKLLGVEIPTREEMRAIEVSERLYQENGIYFMTATLMTKMDTNEPEAHAVTFIISDKRLVTLRYSDPLPFKTFAALLGRLPGSDHNGPSLFLGLIDSVTNRIADILERIGQEMDAITKQIFTPASLKMEAAPNYQEMLTRVGRSGDALSKARESLMTLGRVVAYSAQCSHITLGENHTRLKAQSHDVVGLSDQANYLGNRMSFLLDAVLGLIGIEQNSIIKIFSVAATVFLPPTLIASIYGMNFEHMPELKWHLGYPMALLVMMLSALLPLLYFKRKNWL